MRKKYPLALHIFRRDLRLTDNTALMEALKLSEAVIPCFIFDKRQIEDNNYKSDHCIQFMVRSLQELDHELQKKKGKLFLFYGIAEEVVGQLITELAISAVFINRDYTPFSRARDEKIKSVCCDANIDFHVYADALLHEPEEILKADGKPYTVFTPFYKKASTLYVAEPRNNNEDNYYGGSELRKSADAPEPQHTTHRRLVLLRQAGMDIFKKLSLINNPNLAVKGGRAEALSLLQNLKRLKNYSEIRNFPALEGTTHLSAHNKFGTISIREFYHAVVKSFGVGHTLMNELQWRDFFTHITFHFPHVLGEAFHEKYKNLAWNNNEKLFHAWCEGKTGFPIVDAGMRELNSTGYMHNRLRMIVASFLTKDLHIDWRWGEKYFAELLVDYDPAVNNGNWQWAASTGCDAQPYFRIFNPWLQQQKFDLDCVYIKRWLPELAKIPSDIIHAWGKIKNKVDGDYPLPIVDHAIESQHAKMLYKLLDKYK